MTRDRFLHLCAMTTPVMVGYIPIGMVYGFMCMQAGFSWEWAILASTLILAGSSQFMMIPLVVAGASLPMIAFAVFVINFRHIFYGIPLLDRVPEKGWKRWYTIAVLTDESFALIRSLPKENITNDDVFTVCALDHFWWVFGTFLGVALGSQLQITLQGLDFVLCCLFATLAVELWRVRKTALPLWSALFLYAAVRFVSPTNALALATTGLAFVGFLWARKKSSGD